MSLLVEQNESRLAWLVPLRHFRMSASPFTFFRGSAAIMAGDLAETLTSGLDVQLGGDAHLSNFGAYASPERRLVFDANDFDETLRGPWEWDLKRLAASFAIAGDHLGFTNRRSRDVTESCVRAYRRAMARYSKMGVLEQWYEYVDVDVLASSKEIDDKDLQRRLKRFRRRARKKTSLQAVRKLAVSENGRYRIRSQPPTVLPLRDLPARYDPVTLEAVALEGVEAYKTSLSDNRHALLDRFEPVDVGLKVVGVGSVGMRCLIVLFEGRDNAGPLILQLKEAGKSVLETHLEPSQYRNSGRRVVEGQRMIQAQSDIFLGWTQGPAADFYVRQLRDWKGSPTIEGATPGQLQFYARLCGQTLARGHARSGDAAAISAYLGSGDIFDRAVASFAEAYCTQNMQDYELFISAIDSGQLEARDGR